MTQADRLACQPDALFVYGSLTFPEVLEVLLGRVPQHTRAHADGWRIAALRERPFPVLVPASGTARGIVVTDLSPAEWRVLDAFEAPSYELRELELDLGRGWTYVAGPSADAKWGILPDDWDRDAFDLISYLRRCTEWRRRHQQGDEPVTTTPKGAVT